MKTLQIRQVLFVLLTALSVLLSWSAVAQDNDRVMKEVPEPLASSIMNQLKLARPDFEYSKLRHAPIPGLYEVKVIGGPMLYVNETAKLIIAGELYQIENNAIQAYEHPSISQERALAMSKLNPKDQIVFSPKGETRAYINVFTDTTCGYCRKLHNEIAQINNLGIEVRYLAYPREGEGSVGYQQLVTAWCSKDKQGALTKMKNGQMLPEISCDNNPVMAQYLLGQEIGVEGTPAIVLSDGQLLPGYVPAAQLAQILGLK